jgi:phage-related protein
MRSSQKDLRAFPADAKAELGHSLYLVQNGDRPNK